ncbi:MAG: hypothetical protein DCF19_11470 [Pseudanabaena frigida]|uniref:Circadian input-output histidine kinase CikA n=1 Tax=Pseudanabaena frigida TaxID=945775 RepID=A0A2W4Y0L5_9CYAN|nr:MAG: hypothetical protein DCF19_11470 [Pseudanabaena frigida]
MSNSPKRSLLSNIPLRWVLVVPFVLQIVGAVGLVSYLSYRSGQTALENMAHQVSNQASSRVRDRLNISLQNQNQAILLSQRAIQKRTLNLKDFEQMQNHFWQQINLSLSLSSIYFANENGEMIGYGRVLSQEAIEQTKQLTGENLTLGESVLIETTSQDLAHRKYYLVDDQGKAKQLYGNLPIDNRTTIWYRAGKAAQQLTWSPIYVFKDAPTLGINIVAPIKDEAGNFQGVLSSSIRLTAIGTFLSQLNFSPSGQAFIIDRAGDLVATSTLETPYIQVKQGEPLRLSASQSKDIRTKLVADRLQQQYGNLNQIQTKIRLKIVTEGNTLFVEVAPYQDDFGLDWLLVTVIPDSDFITEIQTNAKWTILLCGLTLLAIIAIGVITARWITRPILKLNQVSEAIAKGDWQEPLPEDQTIAELKALSVSFNLMATQVHQSFDRVETELLENKHFLQQITDHSAQILYILDPNVWVNLYINRQSIDILGYTPEEFQQGGSQFLQSILHPDDIPLLLRNMDYWQTAKDDEVLTTEYRMRHKNGDWVWLRSREVVFARNEHHQASKILGTAQDISNRKQIEIALAEAKETAEAANKAKSEFLANMSHELRTPMNGVLGMVQILSTTKLTEQQQSFVKTIRDSGDALLTVINDILDFSKIESGMLEIEPSNFVLEDVIRSVCTLLHSQAIDKQIDLQYAISPVIPTTIFGDHTRLRQILLNIVGNAIKFTQYGQVSISVNSRLLSQPNQYELSFEIADTGIGITGDRIDKLFQPFTQADASISRKYGGTGLGLSISKSLVELMGGTIWVKSGNQIGGNPPSIWRLQLNNSSVSHGSTFYFTIGVSTSSVTEQPLGFLLEQMMIDNKMAEKFPLRILLVEDNKVNQMVANLMLEQLGYCADVANNGLEAVQAVQSQSYDLIMMDLQMPEMDGLTAARLIRSKLMSQARIIAMTADATPEDRQICLEAGMDDYISKPIDMQEIMQLVSTTK